MGILVNNAAVQFPTENIEDITDEQWDRTFRTNIYSVFNMSKHSVPHMKQGNSVINTTSINPYRVHATLMDYTAKKGAIVGFTRSLAQNVAKRDPRHYGGTRPDLDPANPGRRSTNNPLPSSAPRHRLAALCSRQIMRVPMCC